MQKIKTVRNQAPSGNRFQLFCNPTETQTETRIYTRILTHPPLRIDSLTNEVLTYISGGHRIRRYSKSICENRTEELIEL